LTTLALNTPVAYAIRKVEEKKRLDSGAVIYKIGLEVDGEKLWPVEIFNPKPPPAEGSTETLIVTDSEYGLKAKRPGQGGGGKGGRSPADSASIEAQVAAKLAVEWGAMQYRNGEGPLLTMEQLEQLTKGFAEAIRKAKG
jgi:hypothetical protein